MSNPQTKPVIRFDQVDTQTSDCISRRIGFVHCKYLLPLFTRSILDPNPRRPKTNKVTRDIIDSLDESPEIFQFKSKGLLIGTSSFEELQRNRFKLTFGYSKAEGILDGGHNMLSIGLWILYEYMDEKDWKRIKNWDALIDAWEENYDLIYEDRDEFDFLISVELITPCSQEIEVIEAFRSASIDICAARNNNSQLAQEAKANQRGFYDEIRKRLSLKNPELSARVEWKTNYTESDHKKVIKVRDLVAMSWLPLSVLREADAIPMPDDETAEDLFRRNLAKFSPKLIYSSKAKVSELFDELWENPKIAKQVSGGKYELHSASIGSAFEILCDLPSLYDYLFLNISEAANESGGNFNLIKAIKKTDTFTPYTLQKAKFRMPDGFIMPLFFGLTVLMKVKNGEVVWKVDPRKFLDKKLPEIMGGYKLAIEGGDKDPQKVAKGDLSYNLSIQQFKFSLQNFLTEMG